VNAVRVFVNERPVEVPPGATVAVAVQSFDAALGQALLAGAASVTDARGIGVDPAGPVGAGTILRVIGRRPGADAHA
jgi:hypothetical protein